VNIFLVQSCLVLTVVHLIIYLLFNSFELIIHNLVLDDMMDKLLNEVCEGEKIHLIVLFYENTCLKISELNLKEYLDILVKNIC